MAYLLGTKDLHRENIIAAGEYPVLIDLENIVNIHYNHDRNNASDEVCYQILQSVLFTGLLPFYLWNEKGEGISNSSLGKNYKQKYPFKMSGILNERTSDMKIEYFYPKVKDAKNVATVNGKYYSTHLFQEALIYGFEQAYTCVLNNRQEVYQLLSKIECLKSRYLLADTQRYSMILSSSYHPSLMRDAAEREIFLYSIWKGRKEKDISVVNSEVRSMIGGDIPYFYYSLNCRTLRSQNGLEIKEYFKETPLNLLLNKLNMLNQENMKIQCEYIRLALSISPENKEACMNKVYSKFEKYNSIIDETNNQINYKERIKDSIVDLSKHLTRYAIWNYEHTDVSWFVMQLASVNSMTWNIKPMGYYLYDGLAGILVLVEAIIKVVQDENVSQIRDVLKNKLFYYTKQGLESIDNLITMQTGAYNGESSIIYAYLILYKMTGKEEYLEYARMHVLIIDKIIEQDTKYDLISGNAGAILVIVKLYEIDPKKQYCKLMRKAIEILKRNALKLENGIGWIVEKDIPAMAGMAHGNSGIILALVKVWRVIRDEKYLKLAVEAERYEESLYEEKINNWKDVRCGTIVDDNKDGVAWCHGAAGILLSKIQVYNCLKEENIYMDDETVELLDKVKRDIRHSYKKLSEYPYRDSFCLCHGTFGNMWILEEAIKSRELLKDTASFCDFYIKPEKIKLLPQEKLNPGLMNGYGGVLYYLLRLYKEDLPNVLMFD